MGYSRRRVGKDGGLRWWTRCSPTRRPVGRVWTTCSSPSTGAFARYRAERRAAGKDAPRGTRKRDNDGHIPRDWFQRVVRKPACKPAGIDPPLRPHDLRHSHASWLLAGGADIEVVKERLGHVSIATTGKYVYPLADADETALAACR